MAKGKKSAKAAEAPNPPKSVEKDQVLLDRIEVALRDGIKADPQNANLGVELAKILYDNRKDVAEARKIYRDILQTTPTHVGALNGLSAILLGDEEFIEAEVLLRRALTSSPGNAASLILLAHLLHSSKADPNQLESTLRQALDSDPGNCEALRWLGDLAFARRGDVAAAKDLYARAIKANPGDVIALGRLGDLCFRAGDIAGAKDLYARVLAIDSDDGAGLCGAADCRLAELEEAARAHPTPRQAADARDWVARTFRRAADAHPEDVRVLLRCGAFLESVGHDSSAVDHYARAAQLEPNNPAPLVSLGLVLLRSEEERTRVIGAALLRRAVEADPTSKAALKALEQVGEEFRDAVDLLDQEGSETATDPAGGGAGADGGGQLVKVGAGSGGGGGGARKVLGARELLQMVIARAPPRAPGILEHPGYQAGAVQPKDSQAKELGLEKLAITDGQKLEVLTGEKIESVSKFKNEVANYCVLPGEVEAMTRRHIMNDSMTSDAVARAGSYMYANKPKQTESCLRSMIEADPNDVTALHNLGIFYETTQQDFVKAEGLYRKALEINDAHVPSLMHLGSLMHHFSGNIEEAERLYRRALQFDPMQPGVLNSLGSLVENFKHDYVEAEALYRAAIKADPQSHPAICNLGALLEVRKHNLVEAATTYWIAIETDPTMAMPYFRLGILLAAENKDFVQAETLLCKGLEIDPTNEEAREWLDNIRTMPSRSAALNGPGGRMRARLQAKLVMKNLEARSITAASASNAKDDSKASASKNANAGKPDQASSSASGAGDWLDGVAIAGSGSSSGGGGKKKKKK